MDVLRADKILDPPVALVWIQGHGLAKISTNLPIQAWVFVLDAFLQLTDQSMTALIRDEDYFDKLRSVIETSDFRYRKITGKPGCYIIEVWNTKLINFPLLEASKEQ